MNIWNKLSQVNVDDKETFKELFVETVKKFRNNFSLLDFGEIDKGIYYLVIEENRMNSYFVHIVPKQVYPLFKEMQQKAPNEVLGFSVMIGKHKNKEVRVSCFGIDCSTLGKALL